MIRGVSLAQGLNANLTSSQYTTLNELLVSNLHDEASELSISAQSCRIHWKGETSSSPAAQGTPLLFQLQLLQHRPNAPHRGLGAEVARKFAAEGCNIAINYVNSEAPAQALAKEIESQLGTKTLVIQGDGGKIPDIQNCIQATIKAFGGLDIIVGNAGFTKFSTFSDLDALTYDEWDQCWHTNVLGNHALLKEALPTFNSNPDGGVFIMTGSVAGKSLSGSSMAYSVTKAAQIHLMKCLAQTQGPKVRVNCVLPGLLLTDWGNLYGEERINMLKGQAALKQEVSVF